MATQKIQQFQPLDFSSVANYKATFTPIGTAMSTLGWVLAGDAGQVNWSNVVVPPVSISTPTSFNWRGAWVGGTSYAIGDVSTNGSLTYISYIATAATPTSIQALQNTSNTLTVTAVAASSGQTAVYTVSSGVSSALIGMQFVVSVGGSNLAANNAGTFICTATSGTTSITLGNNAATAQASVTGGSPTAVSSTSVLSFLAVGGSGIIGVQTDNVLVGHSIIITNFPSNNGTYTVTANATPTGFAGAFSCTATGSNATQTGATWTENTAPATDTFHWTPYNYEIWVSNGPASATNPIYMKLVYGVFGTSPAIPSVLASVGTGQTNGGITGNTLNNGTAYYLQGYNTAGSNTTPMECDFCGDADTVSMLLWRNPNYGLTRNTAMFCIDRSRDASGNSTDTFAVVLGAFLATNPATAYQVLFKPGTGSTYPASVAFSATAATPSWPCVNDGSTSGALNGTVAPFLIFPMVGYMANPCLGAIAMHSTDCAEGGLVSVIMYGTTHTFLMFTGGASNILNTLSATGAVGIRWEVF